MRYLVTANIDADKQIYVRRAAWWCANDNRRTDLFAVSMLLFYVLLLFVSLNG
jgi:hypothetical protein